MYICPEAPGVLFGKAEINPPGETYDIPVCQDGTFLGKIVELDPLIRTRDTSPPGARA